MDNQFNQPGGGYSPQDPAGYQNQGFSAGQQGYTVDPYTGQQRYAGAVNPYTGQPTGTVNPYTGQSTGTGTVDPYTGQPVYRNAAEGFGTTAQYPDMSGYSTQQMYQTAYADPGAQQMPYADPGAQQQPYSGDGYQHLFTQLPPEQPPAGFPPQQRKPARRKLTGQEIVRILLALSPLAAAIIIAIVVVIAPQMNPKTAQYDTVATGALTATYSGDCLIVRDETPYDAEDVAGIAYEAQEGSRVERNDLICTVYTTGYSTTAMDTLERYREDMRNYQKQLIEGSTTSDSKLDRLNTEVTNLVTQVRSLVGGAQGSLANVEAQLEMKLQERQLHLEQKYASDKNYAKMQADERLQTQRIASWSKTYSATGPALVSFYSDGYEYSVNASTYGSFEPSEVRSMINGKVPEKTALQKSRKTIYRMVWDGEWYVLFLSDDPDWIPVRGEKYELLLERFGETPVMAEVVDFNQSGGELLVRLKVNSPVEPVMYLRSCEAVLGESVSTLMVNERAICEQEGTTGVMLVEGMTESFIPVSVIHTEGGYAYFQPIQQGFVYEGLKVRLY